MAHDLPLPIDECNDGEIELRRKYNRPRRNCNSLELRSVQTPVFRTQSNNDGALENQKRLVSRHVSSPVSLFYSGVVNNVNSTFGSNELDMVGNSQKKSFRQFMRRMSSRRKPPAIMNETSSFLKDGKKRNNGSIQSINEIIKTATPKQHLISSVPRCQEEPEEPCQVVEDEGSNRLITAEERKYGEIPRHIYDIYLHTCGHKLVVVFILSAFGWQLLRVSTDVWLQQWTDEKEVNPDVGFYFKMYCFLSVISLFFAVLSSSSGQLCGIRARRLLHRQLTNAVLSNSLHYFQTKPVGRIMNRFSNDIAIIDKKIASTSQRLLQFLLLCLCAILINTAITLWFIVLTIPICALYYVVQKFYRCSSRELQRLDSITTSPILSHFIETISGVTIIRAYNQESRFMEVLFKKIEANNLAFNIMHSSNRWLGIALDFLGGMIVFFAILTALVVDVLYPESTTPSLVGLAINYTLLIPIYLNWVVKLYADMEMYIGAVERIHFYIESKDKEVGHSTGKSVPISWPQKGDITFINVSLRHDPNAKEDVISGLNLQIPAGQKVISFKLGSILFKLELLHNFSLRLEFVDELVVENRL